MAREQTNMVINFQELHSIILLNYSSFHINRSNTKTKSLTTNTMINFVFTDKVQGIIDMIWSITTPNVINNG